MKKQALQIVSDGEDLWCEGVRRLPSPNCDARPRGTAIDLLIIHSISLPPGEYGGDYIDQLFTNTLNASEHPYFSEIIDLRVSAHCLIDRAGRITQYVPFNKRAWHAGQSEYCGRTDCNDYSIGIELEGCDDTEYTPEQYASLIGISKMLIDYWDGLSKDNIMGHSDVAPDRKTDPGPGFDWDYYLRNL